MTDAATGLEALGRLVVATGMIVGALLLVRRWAQRGGRGRTTTGVRVIARTGLSRTSVVAVVEVGERRFLVGSGEQGVALLTELDPTEQDATDALADTPVAATSAALPTPPAMDRRTTHTKPWIGLVDRLRAMTVRTHVQGPIHASRR